MEQSTWSYKSIVAGLVVVFLCASIFMLFFELFSKIANRTPEVVTEEHVDTHAHEDSSDHVDEDPTDEHVAPEDRMTELPFVEKDGVKEFTLNAEPIEFEYVQGKTLPAWGYNGQVPGPTIRVTEGDTIRVVFTNHLPDPTTIHWHGVDVPSSMDGVPFVSQDPIQSHETFTYEFVAKPAGTKFYHTHGSRPMGDEATQLDMGLSGAMIIEPRDDVKPDKEFILVLDEWSSTGESYDIFTINGQAFPDTEILEVSEGDHVRIRMINAGTSTIHPMHLHGHQFQVTAADGNAIALPAQLTRNTLPLNPGETFDIEFTANNPGNWMFHCHELHHADGGMMMLVNYEGTPLPALEDIEASEPSSHQMQH